MYRYPQSNQNNQFFANEPGEHPRTYRYPEEMGLVSGPPLGKQKYVGQLPNGRRVPLNCMVESKRGKGYAGDFCRDGYLVAGPKYDKLAAKQARWDAANPVFRALILIGRVLLAILKVLWVIIQIVTVVYWIVLIFHGIGAIENDINAHQRR
jgi:fatty acid desaturase